MRGSIDMRRAAPQRVSDPEKYWADAPPEESERCTWWVSRIREGWRGNTRIRTMGYYEAAHYFGVYIWEYLEVISPMLRDLEQELS